MGLIYPANWQSPFEESDALVAAKEEAVAYWEAARFSAYQEAERNPSVSGWKYAVAAPAWAATSLARMFPETPAGLAWLVGSPYVGNRLVGAASRWVASRAGVASARVLVNFFEKSIAEAAKTGEIVVQGSGAARVITSSAGAVLQPAMSILASVANLPHRVTHVGHYGWATMELAHHAHEIMEIRHHSKQRVMGSSIRGFGDSINAGIDALLPTQIQHHADRGVLPVGPLDSGTFIPGEWGVQIGSRTGPMYGGDKWKRGGLDIDRIVQPPTSRDLDREIMRKGVYVPGVWGMSRGWLSADELNNMKQPNLSDHAMREVMTNGIFIPGVWGMAIDPPGRAPFSKSILDQVRRVRIGTSP